MPQQVAKPSGLRRLTDIFARSARRLAAPLLFAGLLAAPSTMRAQASPTKAPTETSVTPNKNALLNATLIRNAKKDFPAIMHLAQNEYGAYLDNLSDLANRKIKIKNPDAAPVVVINPYFVDVGLALGFDAEDILAAILTEKKAVFDQDVLDLSSRSMAKPYILAGKDTIHVMDPGIKRWEKPENGGPRNTSILMPASNYGVGDYFPGISTDDAVFFANIHEAVHLLEYLYSYDGIDLALAARFDVAKEDDVANNIDGLRYYAITQKRESLADISALGAMLRRGSDISILDIFAEARRQPYDILHLTEPVISGFKAEIEKMGLDAFKNMPQEKIEQFYFSVTEKYGLDYHGLQAALTYLHHPDALEKDIRDRGMTKDSERRKIIHMAQLILAPLKPAPFCDRDMIEKVRQWNAAGEWILYAHIKYQIVTPQTLIRSYAEIMDLLAQKRKTDPAGDKLYTQQMLQLKHVFVSSLATLDYAYLNDYYGAPATQLAAVKTPVPVLKN